MDFRLKVFGITREEAVPSVICGFKKDTCRLHGSYTKPSCMGYVNFLKPNNWQYMISLFNQIQIQRNQLILIENI